MTKLALLFATCLLVFFTAAISAIPSITMGFADEFYAGRAAILRVTTNEIDLTNPIIITSQAPTGEHIDQTYWNRNFIVFGEPNVVNSMDRPTLETNNFYFINYAISACVDEVTRLPLVQVNYNSGSGTIMSFSLLPNNMDAHLVDFPAGNYGSFTFICPMSLDTTQAYAPQFISLIASQFGQEDIAFSLTPPTAWSWRQPIITLNSASYSENEGKLLGGQLKIQFTTDTPGIHYVAILYGPQPIYYNRRNGKMTSFQCENNVEAYIIASVAGFEVHVKNSAANGALLTCIVDVDGYWNPAYTHHHRIVIQVATAVASKSIEFPVSDATFTAKIDKSVGVDGHAAKFIIKASTLNFSSSPLHTNSTIEIRFTGIDVNTIKPTTAEFRQDLVCPDLQGTFSQDGKSIFIKDVSKVVDSFSCNCYFVGSKIVRLDEFTPVPTVQVLIDGVILYNRAVRSTSFPLYLPVKTEITNTNSQIYQDDSTIKHVAEFSLIDNSISSGIVPQQPILILSYDFAATWSVASYANALSCEATSPSSSTYSLLIMTFDLGSRTWTADLSNLIDTDAYQINFRCTRSEAVVDRFDIIQNTPNSLRVSFIDVAFKKGYNYSTSRLIPEQPPKLNLKYPDSPAIPTSFSQYFKLQGNIYMTDFNTASDVADDVSTKILDTIKTACDAYDTSIARTAKLTPSLINKAQVTVSNFSSGYSSSSGLTMYNLYYTIIGYQFQQYDIKSLNNVYGSPHGVTHSQRAIPQIEFSRYFISGSTYDEIQDYSEKFVNDRIGSAFYKDAFSTTPSTIVTPVTPTEKGLEFPTFSQLAVMNTISACGYYEVGYNAIKEGSNYTFNYDKMILDTQKNKYTRFTCAFTEACSSDADCGDYGYCSKSSCAFAKPSLKYPYVQYDSVSDFFEYAEFNISAVESVSVIIVAVIVAVMM